MANINKIRLSGTTYNIEDENAAKSVTLTQAEYDALVSGGTVDPNTFYIISDSSIVYMTSADTESAITQAVSGKQDTLVSGVNIKTVNNQSLLGSGNVDVQGGSITVDTALDSGSTNPVENRVIYNKIDEVEQVTAAALNELNEAVSGKVDTTTYNTYTAATDTALASKANTATTYTKTEVDNAITAATSTKQDTLVSGTNIKTINNESLLGSGNIDIQGGGGTVDQTIISGSTNAVAGGAVYNKIDEVEQVTAAGLNALNESLNGKANTTAFTAHTADTTVHTTSAEKTSWDGAATNASNAITALGGLKLVKLTQAQYDALATKDSNTLYVIVN